MVVNYHYLLLKASRSDEALGDHLGRPDNVIVGVEAAAALRVVADHGTLVHGDSLHPLR